MMVLKLPFPFKTRSLLACGLLISLMYISYPGAAEENVGIDTHEDDTDGGPARVELGFGEGDEGDLGLRMPLPVPVYRARGF